MSDPLFLLDPADGAFRASNEAARRFLGALRTNDLIAEVEESLLAAVRASPEDLNHPVWIRCANGSRSWVLRICIPPPNDSRGRMLLLRNAGLAALDSCIYPDLEASLEDFEHGASLPVMLGSMCKVLAARLDLALVRVLEVDDDALHERGCSTDGVLAEAVRSFSNCPDSQRELVRTAISAHHSQLPAFIRIGAASDEEAAQLFKLGIRSAGAFPLKYGNSAMVLELLAYGVDDLTSEPTKEFLYARIPWIVNQLAHRSSLREQKLLAEALRTAVTPAFITDNLGVIVWVNHAFVHQYGIDAESAIGQTPRILRSGYHGQRYYEDLWRAILGGRPWSGKTVDRAANGRDVTVRQCISPIHSRGRVTHFLAIHTDITEETELASIAETRRKTDELTGLMARAAFEERCRELLISAASENRHPALLMVSIRTRANEVPKLQAETMAFVYEEIGNRLHSILPKDSITGTLMGLDFATLLAAPPYPVESLTAPVIEALDAPFPLLGDSLELRCRVAIAQFPEDGGDIQNLEKSADRRLAEIGD